MAYLKNIEQEHVLKLADEVATAPGQIVSKTLVQNDAVSVTLFAFSKGEEISTHFSEGDAMAAICGRCVTQSTCFPLETSDSFSATF